MLDELQRKLDEGKLIGPMPPLINHFLTTEPGLGAADAKTVADLYSQNIAIENSIADLNSKLDAATAPSTVSGLAYTSLPGIYEDTNLNDLIAPGLYAVSSSTWATLAKNYPVVGLGGAVEVFSISNVGSCIQKYYGFGGYSPNVRIFCRHLYKQATGESYWSPWTEYPSS